MVTHRTYVLSKWLYGEGMRVNRTDRLLAIIWLLRSREKIKAEELAAIFGVTPRSIYRDIQALVEANVPVISLPGPDGGYSLMKEYSVTPITFSNEEVAALFLGASLLQAMALPPYAAAVQSAIEKITRVLPRQQEERLRALQRAIHPELGGRAMNEAEVRHFTVLEEAVARRTVVRLWYRDADGETTERAVEPYGMVYQSGYWYAVAFCRPRQGMRMFRLDRMRRVETTAEPFLPPQEFSFEPYLFRNWREEELSGPRLQVRLRGSPEWLALAEAHPYLRQCNPMRQGGEMQLAVPPQAIWHVRRLALEAAGELEVLAPVELREEVLAGAWRAVARHERGSGKQIFGPEESLT